MVPNPESSAETLYLPIGRYGALNEPSLLVTTMRSKPVSTFLIVTVTPGIDPPDLSVTVPFIVPVTVPGGFAFYGRLAAQETNGFREHSGTRQHSFFLSAAGPRIR